MGLRSQQIIIAAKARDMDFVRAVISDDGIAAVWSVPSADGTGRQHVHVPVSAALAATLAGKPAIQTFLDAVQADTAPRAIPS